jgi:hypothetical protein
MLLWIRISAGEVHEFGWGLTKRVFLDSRPASRPNQFLISSRYNAFNRGGFMRKVLFSLLALAFSVSLAAPLMAQGAPPQGGADQPYTVEYYYKCQWGHQAEFLQLFLKNHYPLLKKIQSTGRILSVKIEAPAYHTSEELRWDYRVTIRYKNSTVATTENPDEAAFIKELWPDQETYKREEQRRFEILLGHIDLPITDVTPSK